MDGRIILKLTGNGVPTHNMKKSGLEVKLHAVFKLITRWKRKVSVMPQSEKGTPVPNEQEVRWVTDTV